MSLSLCFRLGMTAFLLFSTSSALRAGEITGVTWFSGVASVAGTSFSSPSDPNNDNYVGMSPNGVFVTQKNYVGIGPVDLVFDVADTGGTTEYTFVEGVSNSTGLDWSGYHIELGFGVGAGFTKVSGDGLDFDSPDFDSPVDFNPIPGIFPTYSISEDDIIAGGGILPNAAFAGYFQFPLDLPDGITQFTLRQSPIPLSLDSSGRVPEPSSCLLASLGLLIVTRCSGPRNSRRKRI